MSKKNTLAPVFPLMNGRAHEVYGSGRYAFAAILAGQLQGAVLWVRSRWQTEQLHPSGLAHFHDPSRMIIVNCKNQGEILGAAEEALRSGAVGFVAAELYGKLDFRQGRRLQLAAREGGIPGLFMIRKGAGSNAAHTRWCCVPKCGRADSTEQHWLLVKNKSGTPNGWEICWHAKTRRIIVVSETGKQSQSQACTG